MVARFVEKHRVRSHQQDTGERNAHLPSARQAADISVHHGFREIESGKHLPSAAFKGIAAELLETSLRLPIGLDDVIHLVCAIRIGHRRFEFSQFRGH